MVVNPHVYAKLPFDTLRDFAPMTKLGDATLILVAHPSVPPKDLREFDVVGGQIPLVFTAIATAQQFVRSGSLPNVPTFVESGLEAFVVDSWVGILAPEKVVRQAGIRIE